VPGTFSVLTISSLLRQPSAHSEKRFLTPFSDPEHYFQNPKEIPVKPAATHLNQGWCEMKSESYFFVATLMVVGFFFTSSPADSAWPDAMPSYGSSGSPCTSAVHMVDKTHIGTAYTFTVCRALSNASEWKVQLINTGTLQPLAGCGLPQQAAVDEKTFSCTGIPAGTYLASIKYWVPGGGPFTHAHLYFLAP
jgi:hypothetical protein